VAFSWQVIESNAKAGAQREVQQNGRFAMEKMSRIIKSAAGINSPATGNSSSDFSLEMSSAASDPTLIRVNSETLQLKQGESDWTDLTSQRVKVTDFQVRNLSYDNTPGILRVELTLSHINPDNRQTYEASLDFSSSFALRHQGQGGGDDGGSCQGTAVSCDSLTQQTDCQDQDGCSWQTADCQGEINCGEYNYTECSDCPACYWFFFFCASTGDDCSDLDSGQCSLCPDCSAGSGLCAGTVTACQDYSLESNCNNQDGCNWVE
jgi:hypothetical protein